VTIVEFLLARLAEDEKVAHALLFACRDPARRPVFDWCGGPAAEAFWDRFDPAQRLREIEAKQAILNEHTPRTRGSRTSCSSCSYGNSLGASWPCLTVAKAAAVYRNHPDYDEDWR
jgi:hypothetical protein